MNPSKILLLLLSTLIFSNCNNEDDDPSSFSLVGNWQATAISADNGRTVTETPIATFETTFTFIGEDLDLNMNFEESPNNFSSEGTYTQVVTITDSNGSNTQQLQGDELFTAGTWERSDQNVRVTATDGSTQNLFIVDLNDSSLQLRLIFESTTDLGGGATETQTATIFYTFEKI